MNLRHLFEKHFLIFTSRNRPNIPGRFSYGKISIWPRTVIGWALLILLFIAIIISSKLIPGCDSKRAIGLSNYNNSNTLCNTTGGLVQGVVTPLKMK